MRLFLGLQVPADVRDALVVAMQPSWTSGADLAWTRPGGWHVTLAYVGETESTPERVAAAAAPAVVDVHGPTLALGDVTWFDRSWVVGVASDPAGWCVEVGSRLQEALAGAGVPVVRRRVEPHLTLARRRGRRGSPRAEAPVDLPVPDLGEVPTWTVADLTVFASRTGDGPARYPVVASLPLG